MKATRDSFGEEVARLGELNPDIVVLDADLSKSTKSAMFAEKFPERFFQMGIAEANMIGTAAGLAMEGKIPFACSFGCFLTGRYDQIRMSVAYNQANVKLVGTHAGLTIGEDGHSQMGLEDVATLRSLPQFQILQPADDREARQMIQFMVESKSPAYIRLTRQKMPDVNDDNYKFQLGRWMTLEKGSDVVVFATGQLLHSAMDANKKAGGKWTVVNSSSLNPIDRECIQSLGSSAKLIVTAEDHYITGGLGSAVAETMAEQGISTPLLRIGVNQFGESGTPDELLKAYGLDGEGVYRKISEKL